VLAACGSDTADQAPPSDAVVVVGTATCTLDSMVEEIVDGISVIDEEFKCKLRLSDPRVSGTETLQVVSRVADWELGGAWTAEGRIVTDGGEWQGGGQGVVDLVGVLPFAGGIVPSNFGGIVYEGVGAFEGLEFTYYFAGSNATEGIAGWISDDS
jgi:hypothetical protein